MTNCVSARGEDSPSRITTKREGDKTEVTLEQNKAVISVRSPVGISQAIIVRIGNHWPTTVMLRLRLNGLEHLKVTNGDDALEAAVSSQHGQV
ncbi:hypothetical protein SAMN06265222_101609 [Neorhodopirellula lusitana]|uniref:Uncharacterized protein n=1 Tax=Neorhodopirellula lusitana TaxID=445327 RepID=A0ABY1PQ12_9BACT|nr:hypothetical protein [Neorhodopirellula lusitana]SMP41557.1 hypothetical protein SAMN06265222_101609 [Neorhodopirellula lusitana]